MNDIETISVSQGAYNLLNSQTKLRVCDNCGVYFLDDEVVIGDLEQPGDRMGAYCSQRCRSEYGRLVFIPIAVS